MHNKETICVDCLQLRVNRYILLAIGLWPYQQSKLTKLYLMLCIVILTSFIILQLLVTLKCSSDVFINVMSSVLMYISFSIKFISLIVRNKIVKYMLEQLYRLYNELTDKNEIIIIKRYNNYAKLYTVTLTCKAYCFDFHKTYNYVCKQIYEVCSKIVCHIKSFKRSPAISLFAIAVLSFCSFWPKIYDVFIRNGTRSRLSLPITIVYFVDQEKYAYLILLHMHASIIIGLCAIVGSGTFLIAYLLHVCGMFKIACYRFARVTIILSRITAQRKETSHNEDLIYRGIVYALNMQRKAVEYYTVMITGFGSLYFYLIIVGVFCLSLNLFQLLSFEFKTVLEFFLSVLFFTILIIYTLICNWIAQDVINHNNDVYVATYDIQWYMTPLQIQKLIVFILLRSNKTFCVSIAGGLFNGSIENAVSVLSTAFSYCLVLQSIKH